MLNGQFNSLTTNRNTFYLKTQFVPRHVGYKSQSVMLYREIIAVFFWDPYKAYKYTVGNSYNKTN